MGPMQEVDTNENKRPVAIKGPPTTMPTAESEAPNPEPVRMAATPPVNPLTV